MEETQVTKKLPTREKREVVEVNETKKEEVSNLERIVDEIHGKVNFLEDQMNANNEVLQKNIDNLNQFYSGFSDKTDELLNSLNKEVNYTRSLEQQISQKKAEFESLELKKALEDDRAKFSLTFDKMEKELKEGLNKLDKFKQVAIEEIQKQIAVLDSRIAEVVNVKTSIEDTLKDHRKAMTDAGTREYKLLKANCDKELKEMYKQIEDLQKASISFLTTCSEQNEKLIKKIPKQKNEMSSKDIMIYIMVGICFIGMVGLLFMML